VVLSSSADGLSLVGTYAYDVPDSTDGDVITYLLPVFAFNSADGGVPAFDTVQITTGAPGKTPKTKTGAIDKQNVKSLPKEGFDNYECRPYVIKTNGNGTDLYFVGLLVDLPEGSTIQSVQASDDNANHLVVKFTDSGNANSATFCPAPISSNYQEFFTVHCDGHDDPKLKGKIDDGDVDLYTQGFIHVGSVVSRM
jgi:hypothetical protein